MPWICLALRIRFPSRNRWWWRRRAAPAVRTSSSASRRPSPSAIPSKSTGPSKKCPDSSRYSRRKRKNEFQVETSLPSWTMEKEGFPIGGSWPPPLLLFTKLYLQLCVARFFQSGLRFLSHWTRKFHEIYSFSKLFTFLVGSVPHCVHGEGSRSWL